MKTKYCTLKDGRTLAFCEFGDPNGIPVFHAHGGPGSRYEGLMFDKKAKEHGYRMIATDRPGMGESTYLEGRRLLDYPKDIAELADALHIEKFGVTGWSGGGAHTTVCAYAIPDRLLFNMTFAGYTNLGQFDRTAELLGSNAGFAANELGKENPDKCEAFFEPMRNGVEHDPENFYKGFTKWLCPADLAICRDPSFKEMLMKELKEAFHQGCAGTATDTTVHFVDWGFRLNEIKSRIHVFHGTADTLVPLQFAQHLAENVNQCKLHIFEGEGHFFPFENMDKIFDIAKKETNI